MDDEDLTSGKKKQAGVSRQEVSNSNTFDALNLVDNDDDLYTNGRNSKSAGKGANYERQMLYGKLMLVNDDGKPLPKVVSTVNADSDSEVEEVFNETTGFMKSTSLKSGSNSGYETKSLLEQWRKTKRDDDYDPYDDNMYESHDVSENLQAICDDFDIKFRGRKKK
ncbi:hypothetical protein Tco_0397677 [Tanacetum coccineum]